MNVSVTAALGTTFVLGTALVKVAAGLIVVWSAGLAAAVPAFVWTGSPPPNALAVLEMALTPVGVVGPTTTGTLIGAPLAPLAIDVDEVHVMAVPPETEHDQPQ